MIGTVLVVAVIARIIVGDWQITDAFVPLVMLALFPFFEWMIHVFILHWRPKRVGRLTIDPLLSQGAPRPPRRSAQHPLDLHTVEIACDVGSSARDRQLRCWRFRGSAWA